MDIPQGSIVVAVGVNKAEAALTFAAAEAERVNRPLHLIHVLEVPPSRGYADIRRSALKSAQSTLVSLREDVLRTLRGDVPVTIEVVDEGGIVPDLASELGGASLVVLQHRAFGPLQRMLMGSVVKGVAGRAVRPVVSVPDAWVPPGHPRGVVTAGVQDPGEAGLILRGAFEEAEQRQAQVVILHAWWLASGYDIVAADDAMREQFAASFKHEVRPVLETLRQDFPSLEVSVQVRHSPPVEAVLDAAEKSDLLVIGRRHHLLPLGSHLGPVARSAIDRSPAPVLITPEP